MRKTKKWISLAMAACMALSMTACGSTKAPENTQKPPEETADLTTAERNQENSGDSGSKDIKTGEKQKLTIAVWNGNWAKKLEAVQNNFNGKYPQYQMDIQMQTGDYSDFLGAKVAADDLPDMYILTPYKQVEAFAQAGRLMDLSGEGFVEKVYPQALNASTYEEKVYGYPANYEYLGVFYNKELFKKAGIEKVPSTRAEFEAVCQKLEAAGIQPIASTYKDSWTLKHLFSVLMTTQVQDDIPGFIGALNSGNGTFDVPGVEECFQFADLMKKYSGSNMMDQDSTSGFNALANGQAAMLISGEFSQATVAALDNPPDIGCFAVPVSSDPARNKLAVDVGIVYVVNVNTKNFEGCQTALEFMSNPDDPEGYIAITAANMGDAPPAMPFSGGVPSSAAEDYKRYADAGETVPWVYQQYVNGFDVISGDVFQGYIAGAKDQKTVIQELDENYKNFVK